MDCDIKKEDLPEITREKHKLFIKYYVIHMNATKAALLSGYSKDSVRQQGTALMANPSISVHIQYILQQKHKELDIQASDVIRELKGVGFSRMTDFVEFGDKDKADALNEDDFDSYDEYIQEKEMLSMAFKVKSPEQMGESLAAIDELSIGGKGVLNIKTRGKIKALELIGKHIGMWKHESGNNEADRESNLDRIRSAIKLTRRRNRERTESYRESESGEVEK